MSATIDIGAGAQAITSPNLKVVGTVPSGVTEGFSNIVAAQIAGIDDQGRVTFDFYHAVEHTIFISFKSNYAGEGKDVAGGFAISLPTNPGQTQYTADSAANLVDATEYTVMLYADEDGGSGLIPTGNDVVTSNPFTITASVPAPTSITPTSVQITQGATTGFQFATFVSDVQGATFLEIAPTQALADVASGGAGTLAANADTLGTFPLHVRATTGGGSHDQEVTLTVVEAPPGGGGDVEADATVSTTTALYSTLDSWESDWAGTIPAGKTINDDRVIAIDTTVGAVTLSNYNFQTGTRKQVSIRSAGTKTNTESSVKVNGKITMWDASGITLTLLEVVSGNRALDFKNIVDCHVIRCSIKGTASPNVNSPPSPGNYGMFLSGNNTRVSMVDCAWQSFGICLYSNGASTDMTWQGNCFDVVAHDQFRIDGGPHTRFTLSYGTEGRISAPTGTDPHEDFLQTRFATFHNPIFEYNLAMERGHFLAGTGTRQCFFFGDDSTVNNGIFRQNFTTDSKGGIPLGGVTVLNTPSITFNTSLLSVNTWGAGYTTWYSGDNNCRCLATAGSSPGGIGPNGLGIVVGSPAVLSEQYDEVTGPLSQTCTLQAIEPLTASRLHWNHATKTGSWDLMRQIFNSECYWELAGWPIAKLFHDLYNSDNYVVTPGYTGNFDADGDNV